MYLGLQFEHISLIIDVFKKFDKIKEATVFGSRAKGNYKPGSDIDIAIRGRNIVLNDLLQVHNTLDNLDLPYKFDLVNYSKIKDAEVLEHINRVGKRLYGIQQKQLPAEHSIKSKSSMETPASSSIKKIVYSSKENVLEVELKQGKIYQYYPVHVEGWEEIKSIVESGDSVGAYYNLVVKNKYDNYREVLINNK